MPNIRDYNAGTFEVQTSGRGIAGLERAAGAARATADAAVDLGNAQRRAAVAKGQTTADLGNAVGSTIQTVGGLYVQHQEKAEISASMKEAPVIQKNANDMWENAISQEGALDDPNLADKFIQEEFEPAMETWVNGATTEKGKLYRQQVTSQLRQHVYEKTAADVSSLSGQQAAVNFTQGLTVATNAVSSDPSSLNTAIGLQTLALNAWLEDHPNLTPAAQAKLRTELTQNIHENLTAAAGKGMIRKNPEQFLVELDEGWGSTYLDADARDNLRAEAERTIKAREIDARGRLAAQREAEKAAFERELIAAGPQLQPDGTVAYPPDAAERINALRLHPGGTADKVEGAIGEYQRATRDALGGTYVQSRQDVKDAMVAKIGRPFDDPNALRLDQVQRAYAADLLSKDDFEFFKQVVPTKNVDPARAGADARFNDGVNGYARLVNDVGPFGKYDRNKIAREMAFRYDARKRYLELQASGMSATEAATAALDPRNPQGLQMMLNANPAYFGNSKAALKEFGATARTGVRPQAPLIPPPKNAKGEDVVWKPGRSAADILAEAQGGRKPKASGPSEAEYFRARQEATRGE